MILRYRIQSVDNENFLMDIDMPHAMSLLQFNDFVIREVGYDPCMTSIFSLSSSGERLQEYTCIDMGGDFSPDPIPMSDVSIGKMLVDDVCTMELVYDNLENRSFIVEFLGSIDPVDGLSYPRVSFANSVAPNQYTGEVPLSSKSIFDEMMDGMDGCDTSHDSASDDEW